MGLEVNTNNIETVLSLRSVRQLPEASPGDKQEKLDELYSYLLEYNRQPSPEKEAKLNQLIQQAEVKSIVHSEGLTVWEHTRKTIQAIEKLKIENKLKQELKIVMLYHDLGKVEVYDQAKNQQRTQQKLKQDIVHQTMIGHEKVLLIKFGKACKLII